MTDKVQAFGVERANNTRRDAVWKSDYDALAAELANRQQREQDTRLELAGSYRRIHALEAALREIATAKTNSAIKPGEYRDGVTFGLDHCATVARKALIISGVANMAAALDIDLPQSETGAKDG